MKMKPTLVFVYGSLRKGMGNHSVLNPRGSMLVDEYTTPPEYHLADLGYYPAVLKGGGTAIKGELYAVSQEVWEAVEYLEGYPSFYDRVELTTPHGVAIMYYLPHDLCRPEDNDLVESGDWVEYYENQSRLVG